MEYIVIRNCIVTAMLAGFGATPAAVSAASASGGTYSAHAVMGYPLSKPGEYESIPAPDGHAVVQPEGAGTGTRWYVDIGSAKVSLDTDAWPFPELLWSPDAKALAVTYSDGGSMGNYHLGVYLLSNAISKAYDVTASAQTDFLSHLPKSYDSDDLNLAAVSWLDGSKHLLVAVEVIPESTYAYMGTFALYEVSVPDGKIIKRYGQLEAKRKFWNELGPELRSADDGCSLKSHSCDKPEPRK